MEAADPTGRWWAGWDDAYSVDSVIWDSGQPAQANVPLGHVQQDAISSNGVLVGSGEIGRRRHGFAYVDGTLTMLGRPRGARDVAIAGISDDGIVSGTSIPAEGGRRRAWLWSLDQPEDPWRLRVPAGSQATAIGTSADGSTAVNVTTVDSQGRIYLYDRDGERSRLHGTGEGFNVGAHAIANGWVAGSQSDLETGESHLVRWPLSTGVAEIVPAPVSYFTAVNSSGTVVGRASEGRAAIYTDETIWLPAYEGRVAIYAYTLDDHGDAAGMLVDSDWAFVAAVRWDCTYGS